MALSINEKYEISLSTDGITYSPFQTFVPGESRYLSRYVRFRVTTWGDFEKNEYRFKSFSGIVSDATFAVGGFGVTPFGRYPFGDGGICEEASNVTFVGEGGIALSGSLTAAVQNSVDLSGGVSLSGALESNIQYAISNSGALSMSGDVTTVVTNPSESTLFSVPHNISLPTSPVYISFVASESSSPSDVYMYAPVNMEILAIRVVTSTTLSSGASGELRVYRNDAIAPGIVVPLTAGNRLHTGTGVVSLSAGDLWTFRALRTSSNPVTIRYISIEYRTL